MMQRHLVGLISIVLLLSAAGMLWSGPTGSTSTMLSASFLRMGLVCGTVWLAWPNLQFFRRAPIWVWAIALICATIVAFRPKLLIFVAPLLLALAVLYGFGQLRR